MTCAEFVTNGPFCDETVAKNISGAKFAFALFQESNGSSLKCHNKQITIREKREECGETRSCE